MTAADLTIADLKARVDILEVVARHVKLQGRGSEQWGCCPFHSDRRPSFKVDPDRQQFHCFGCDARGDVVDFVARIEHLDFKEAIARVAELSGTAPIAHKQRPAKRDPASDRRAEANQERAQEIWRQAHPLCQCEACIPGRVYLASRGITHWPKSVHFHGQCPFLDVEEDDQRILRHAPAIIAPVNCHRTVLVVGVWRIRLTPAGAKVERRALGPAKGNCSRLFWPEGDELAIAEGAEDGLAVYQLTGLPCWAALSAGNMAELGGIPSWVRSVTIFADADDVGRQGAHQLARRLREEGRSVRVVKALAGKDPNGQLLAGRPAA